MNEDPIKYLIPELKIDEWLPIEYFQYIPNGVTSIHCDTRDFETIISKEELDKSKILDGCVDVFDMIQKGNIDKKYLIHRQEIPQLLKRVKRISGGDCKWRCLNFATIKTKLGWLKYIRMYYYKDDYFVVCDGYAEPIDYLTMNEENLEKEHGCGGSTGNGMCWNL